MENKNCCQHNNKPVYLCIQIHILLFFIVIYLGKCNWNELASMRWRDRRRVTSMTFSYVSFIVWMMWNAIDTDEVGSEYSGFIVWVLFELLVNSLLPSLFVIFDAKRSKHFYMVEFHATTTMILFFFFFPIQFSFSFARFTWFICSWFVLGKERERKNERKPSQTFAKTLSPIIFSHSFYYTYFRYFV